MKDTSGPAYPGQWIDTDSCGEQRVRESWPGMSLRQYAAIELRVPQSGTPWLDAMITEARRMDYAGQSLSALAVNAANKSLERGDLDERAVEAGEIAGEFADAVMTAITTMLAARTPQAISASATSEPAPEWPAMPEGLPPLPSPDFAYIGKGIEHEGPLRFMYYDKEMGRWMHASRAYGCMAFHYAVHRDDLPKVRRVQP